MNKVVVLSYFSVLFCSFGLQQVIANENGLMSKVLACGEVKENKERLECFDTLTEKKTIEKIQVDSFAKEQVVKTEIEKAEDLTSITLTINKLSKTLRGQWVITTDSGQKWQQKDSLKFKLKVDQRIVISKGALGSFYLKKENSNKNISVKRLK